MATLKFLLRNKTATKPVTIYYDIHISATNRLRGSTKLKTPPIYWDAIKQKVRSVAAASSFKDSINSKISDFQSFVFDKLNDYKTFNENEIVIAIKEDIDIYFGKKKVEVEEVFTFYSYVEKFIEQSKNRTLENTGTKLSRRTYLDYKKALDLVKCFEKEKKYEVSFESINLEFYYSFIEYLESLDYSLNTIGKHIKVLKVFLNSATEQGYNTNLTYKNKRFVKPTVTSDQIYLNLKELDKIVKLDLSGDSKLANARDLFIIGSFTGLRVSDFNGLTKKNITTYKGQRIFNLVVKKTGKYLPIPLHPVIEEILSKNNGHPPKQMNAQDINDALRLIGRKAKINEKVTINKIKGGKKLTLMLPKYELIKNHTARRSFCTNAYITGMSSLDIMAISGHTSERTFLNYIKITGNERAIKIADNPFFKEKNILKVV